MSPTHLEGLAKALAHGGGTHTLDDVLAQAREGAAAVWQSDDERAVIVTEVYDAPQKRVCRFWLATGELDAVIALSHEVMEWARGLGCEWAEMAGRKGWERVLKDEGWSAGLTLMGRKL